MEVLKNLNFSRRYASLAPAWLIFGLFHGTAIAQEEPPETVFRCRADSTVSSVRREKRLHPWHHQMETSPPNGKPPPVPPPTETPTTTPTPTTPPPAQAEELRVLVAEVVVQGARSRIRKSSL
ncbi:MAG UNVERIFIED_CONTAM: hypothetical protein LVR29_14780 [Microcystis novacekii LVE1205-3]